MSPAPQINSGYAASSLSGVAGNATSISELRLDSYSLS